MTLQQKSPNGNTETNADLARLRELEVKIALEIQRICEKNGLHCFLVYGTLLGAVRHGGFIPWDDDMDMGMLRADYEKFVEACKTDLGPEFLWQSWDNDPSYPFIFGKVRLKGTHTQEKFSLEGVEDGIYVDVFAFDAVPDGAWAEHLQRWWHYYGTRLLWMKKGYGRCIRDESAIQRLRYAATAALVRFIPYDWLRRRIMREQRRFENLPTRRVAPYSRSYAERAWVSDLVPITFEGKQFWAFRETDAYLRNLYGNYMELPPEDKRVCHEFRKLDFGPYGNAADGA